MHDRVTEPGDSRFQLLGPASKAGPRRWDDRFKLTYSFVHFFLL